MKTNIKATGIELTPAISDYVNKRVSGIEKYLDSGNPSIVAQVEVGKTTSHHKSGEIFRAEVRITGGGLDHYAVAEESDLYAAIDAVKDEITRELTREKGRRFALARRGGQVVKDMMKGFYTSARKFRLRGRKNISEDDEL